MSGSATVSLRLAAHSMDSKMSSHIALYAETTSAIRSVAYKRTFSGVGVGMNT